MASKSLSDLVKGNLLLVALMYILIGIVMLVLGSNSIGFIFWLSGVIFILIGIIQILLGSTDVKGGLITIIIGIILVIIGIFDDVAKVLVGIILILSALPSILGSSSAIAEKFGMQPVDVGNALFNKIFTIVLLIVGICLIIGLFVGVAAEISDILIRVGGLVLLVIGLVGLIKVLKS